MIFFSEPLLASGRALSLNAIHSALGSRTKSWESSLYNILELYMYWDVETLSGRCGKSSNTRGVPFCSANPSYMIFHFTSFFASGRGLSLKVIYCRHRSRTKSWDFPLYNILGLYMCLNGAQTDQSFAPDRICCNGNHHRGSLNWSGIMTWRHPPIGNIWNGIGRYFLRDSFPISILLKSSARWHARAFYPTLGL